MARALVVDGDTARTSRTRELLEELALEVTTVRDATEAYEALRDGGKPLLLVTKLALARGDGITLLRRLRALSAADHETRAVVLSGSRELRDRAAQLRDELGIDAILSTAVSKLSLRRVLTTVTGSAGMRMPAPIRQALANPALRAKAEVIGADFGLRGLEVSRGAPPNGRQAVPLVGLDHQVLGHLWVPPPLGPVSMDTLEVIARELVRELEGGPRQGRVSQQVA